MNVQQFYDKGLAHASYAIEHNGQVAIVDPGRDPQPYLDFASSHNAQIVAVIETHPHADFVSSHMELHSLTGATIYASALVGADYPHEAFDEGAAIKLGGVTLISLNTPGHSPDSISIVLRDEQGKDHAVFTGDTLFIGDVGRPDLRENAGNITAQREELARQMYRSTRDKLMKLPEDVLVYPAHGAGSLCGKNLSTDTVSSIGRELRENYALQPMSEDDFVDVLLEGQPFIPKYFGFNVGLNKQGAPSFEASVAKVIRAEIGATPEPGHLVIDTRPADQFKAGHLPGAINLMDGGKFETWLGSIVGPQERFYLIAESEEARESVIRKAAKIGYEGNIISAMLTPSFMMSMTPILQVPTFVNHLSDYTIVDIRNAGEFADGAFFEGAINIPLPELRERASEIPTDKPIVIHCAGGYRSAAGSSIVDAALDTDQPIFDLSEAVKDFQTAH
ncbi:MAG: MBL fold metallo-hydrolase [Bacteroidia bacterium]|nr:MBL fold metallo-hydrolase [Bacteroidia bacterium]